MEGLERNSTKNTKWHNKLRSYWLVQELIILNTLAWPCVCNAFLSKMLAIVSLIFTGHIGSGVYLDGAALALSFANIAGTSIIIGMASGMETLCSQANGAKNYKLVGVYYQRAMILCLLFCFPIWAMWLNAESILILLHQDVGVAKVTGDYLRILCFAKPAVIIFLLSSRFMQTQNVVFPIIFLTALGNVVNIICHYLFVYLFGFGVEGSALSITIAYWSLAISYITYIRCSTLYQTSWPGWNLDVLRGWVHYCKYGIPGLITLCLEWWMFEIGFLIVGATSLNPRVEVGIFTIMLNLGVQLFTLPIGYSLAGTVRVGNLLGANNPSLAKKVSFLCLITTFVFGVFFCIGVFVLRPWLPRIFTKDDCIIAGATSSLIITAIYENFDGVRKMGSGILNGCGRQKISSIVNFIIFLLIGAPLACYLCVVFNLATKGFWIGMSCAIFLQALAFFLLIIFTDWRKVADRAQENAGLAKVNKQTNSTPLLTNYTSLYNKTRKANIPLYRDMIKLLIVTALVGSFVIGLCFSILETSSNTNFTIVQSYNSTTFNTTQESCPY
ncbi:Solute carrier family 47 [Oopsacas minuta]|uniref:Multidrug and toxin extrusion protein n=1 Tax=Oopsacas minuta TaxID=111878 RepID=A0AAV7KE13_9METZ|nr:Solute carrier family 47 [Oopsacas minuta]